MKFKNFILPGILTIALINTVVFGNMKYSKRQQELVKLKETITTSLVDNNTKDSADKSTKEETAEQTGAQPPATNTNGDTTTPNTETTGNNQTGGTTSTGGTTTGETNPKP